MKCNVQIPEFGSALAKQAGMICISRTCTVKMKWSGKMDIHLWSGLDFQLISISFTPKHDPSVGPLKSPFP